MRTLLFAWVITTTASVWAQEGLSERADMNGDGVLDTFTTTEDRGSGFWELTWCAEDGATGDRLCVTSMRTAYARFSGLIRETTPADRANRAEGLIEPIDCVDLDASSPGQGALWQLARPNPSDGELTVAPTWVEGPPVVQERVCMTPEQALQFPSAFGWDDTGAVRGQYDSLNDLTIVYAASWRVWTSEEADAEAAPAVILELPELHLYQWAHALAVYEPAANRHAWIVNFADGTEEGFKVDRRERIVGVEGEGNRFSVQVAHSGREDSVLSIEVD